MAIKFSKILFTIKYLHLNGLTSNSNDVLWRQREEQSWKSCGVLSLA